MKIINKRIGLEFFFIFLLSCGVAIFNVTQPLLSSSLLDSAVNGNLEEIIANIIKLLIVTILLLIIEFLRKLSLSDYKRRITNGLKEQLLKGILSKPYNEFNSINSQKYISLFNNEVDEIVNNYYVLLIDILFSVFSICIYSISLISLHPILAIAVFFTNLLPMAVPRIFRKSLQDKKTKYLELLQKYNVKVGDAITGYDVIKTNLATDIIQKITNKACQRATKMGVHYENKTSLCQIITGLFSYMNYLCIIIIGVYLIYRGILTPGGLLAAVSVSELLVYPVTSISYQINSFSAVGAVRKTMFHQYMTKQDNNKNGKHIISEIDTIEINNLSYYYGEQIALDRLNFTLEKGKKYLVYGLNGSGKSTLFKLLSKMYDNYTGEILVNGVELKSISEESFYKNAGFVLQSPFMFNDTLINNITLYDSQYRSESIEAMINQVRLERIRDNIFNKSEYVDSENNISGGEKQKINMARILIQNKKILFLDEATAAFDSESNKIILTQLLKDKDLMIVNIEHKVSKEMVDLYDEIIVLEHGNITKIVKTKEEKEEFAHIL